MARKQGHNKSAYEAKIKDAINTAFRQSLADPRLTMISVTRVDLTTDYSLAKVYWDTFDAAKRGSIKDAIEGSASKLRSILAKELNIRHTPKLTFFYDSQYEDEAKIAELLKNTENNIDSEE